MMMSMVRMMTMVLMRIFGVDSNDDGIEAAPRGGV